VDALDDLNMRGTVQLVISGGIRAAPNVAKALAMGADAWRLAGVLVALRLQHRHLHHRRQAPVRTATTCRTRTAPGFCHHCHTGKCPVGSRRQDAELELRLDPPWRQTAEELLEDAEHGLTTIARACGKQDVHHLKGGLGGD